MDWERELVIAHLVKQKVAEVDIQGMWENTLPEVAASQEQLRAIETRLGCALDPQYREFLLRANGWRAFMQHIDILGIDDLAGGPRFVRAVTLIESLEPLVALCGFGKRDLLPIAVSSDDIDVMVMTRPHTSAPGKVLWRAGGVIDTYPDYYDWFLAMVDYNRREYQRLAGQLSATRH